MCFNAEMSYAFTALAVVVAALMYRKFPSKPSLAIGVLYFGVMELLQALQYSVIDQCDNPINKLLTVLGIIHITWQPYFIHLMTGAFAKTDEDKGANKMVRRLAAWAAVFLLLTGVLGPAFMQDAYSPEETLCLANSRVNMDWIRGPETCTKSGLYHLAWTMPLVAPSYWMPNSFIHFFVLFMPYFCQQKSIFTGLLFLATGPVLAAWITPVVSEQATIWCFFSILQICVVSGRLLLPRSWRLGKKSSSKKTN